VQAEVIANSRDNTGVMITGKSDIVWTQDSMYLFDTGSNTLTRITLFPRQVETISAYQSYRFNALTAYNGRFYMANDANIYELNLDGKLSVFVDSKDLTYNDGNSSE